MIRIAVIDDDPIARRGIEFTLLELPEVEVVASVASLREFAQAFASQPSPDVVILDLYLDAVHSSLAAVTEIAMIARVLVMSADGRPADVLGAIRAGARGYMTKDSGPELIVSAVEAVAAGGFSLSSRLADILRAQLLRSTLEQPGGAGGPHIHTGRPALSPREEETLGHIARGFTHAQIATRMGVRKTTVDTYVERIRSKLQVGNKAELTRAALQRLDFRARL